MSSRSSMARRMSAWALWPARLLRMIEHVTEFGRMPCADMSSTRAHIPLRSRVLTSALSISLYVTWLDCTPASEMTLTQKVERLRNQLNLPQSQSIAD